jgi:uncharacterized protein (TIGR02246 family)
MATVMETAEQQIRRTVEDWHRRTAQGDLDAVLGLMSEDAVFLRCGRPPMTKTEFAAGFREGAGRARIQGSHEVKDIRASGDVAYLWSYISIVMTSKENGASTERDGHVLTVFRKSPSGEWLLARDTDLIAAAGPRHA